MRKSTRENLKMIFRILVGVLYILPVILLFIYSFHPDANFLRTGIKLFPDNMTLDNYRYVFQNLPVGTYFKNTFVVVVISLPIWLCITSFAAYGITFFNYPLKNAIFALLLTGYMMPGEVTFIVNYATIHKLDLINTYTALCITQIASVGAVILIRNNILSLPISLWEAARMDGCGKMKYFFHIILPLCKPILTAQLITHFIGIYNSYFWPLMVTTRPEWHTIMVGVKNIIMTNGFGVACAGSVICSIIPLGIYLLGQKGIVSGMSAGAVKG